MYGLTAQIDVSIGRKRLILVSSLNTPKIPKVRKPRARLNVKSLDKINIY